jgi:hypothetical protein
LGREVKTTSRTDLASEGADLDLAGEGAVSVVAGWAGIYWQISKYIRMISITYHIILIFIVREYALSSLDRGRGLLM